MQSKRGYMDFYILSRIFWSFLIGLIAGLALMYLYLKDFLPFKIPFL